MLSSKIIGLVGSDKAEIIHYISRILCNLGKHVLLIDHCETYALTYTIPYPPSLTKERGRLGITDYRGVSFTRNEVNDSMKETYDYILIDFGYQFEHTDFLTCNEIWFVTDMQRHNVKRLLSISIDKTMARTLIIKDMISRKFGLKYIWEELRLLGLNETNTHCISYEEENIKEMVNCQYNHVFKFMRISNEFKDTILDLLGDIELKDLKRAYRKASRGA